MACPAGHSNEKPPNSITKYQKPHIYPTLTPPDTLKNYVSDAIYLLGGQYAILCQFAHPSLALGTAAHSNFASRLLNRLQTTARFLNAAVYGTQAEKEAIFSVIHSRHASVKGEDYDADDAELHKWTAATLYMALVVVHEAFFGTLSRELKRRLYRESAVYGTSLRMPGEMWPESLEAFEEYWEANVRDLRVTPEAVGLCRELLWPRRIPVVLVPLGPVARCLTVNWLPERLRVAYGLGNGRASRLAYKGIVGYTKVVYPLVPRALKTLPSRLYMKDMRKAVKRVEETGSWGK